MSSTATTQHQCVRCPIWSATRLILWPSHLAATCEDATAPACHKNMRQVLMGLFLKRMRFEDDIPHHKYTLIRLIVIVILTLLPRFRWEYWCLWVSLCHINICGFCMKTEFPVLSCPVLLQLRALQISWIWRRPTTPHTQSSSLSPTAPTQIIPSQPSDAMTHTLARRGTTPVRSRSCPAVQPMRS